MNISYFSFNSTAANFAPLYWRIMEGLFSGGDRLIQHLDLANFRYTLYLIMPEESMFSSIDQVPNYNLQISTWWIIFIAIEFSILSLLGKSNRFALNDSITSCCAGILSQCFNFGYVWIWDNFRLLELPWNSKWTWALCFLTQDFAYYIGHRAIHEIGIFWGMHTIHHSSQYFNFSTSFRQAAIQDAGLAIYDIMQAFFIPPPIFLVHRYFSEIFQFWMHTSLIGSLGPLGWILNTPSHHRAERLTDPPIYGLVKNERSFNQIWLQFHSFKVFLFDKWRETDDKGKPVYPRSMEKLKAIFFPPNWSPGMPVRLFFHWATLRHSTSVPAPQRPPLIYNPPLPIWLKKYIFCHFLLILAFFLHFEHDRSKMGWQEFTIKLAFFIFSMQSFGALFDHHNWAPYAEIFRCFCAVLYYCVKIALDEHVWLYRIAECAIFSISLFLWICRFCFQLHGCLIRKTNGRCDEIKIQNKKKLEERQSFCA